MPSESEQQLVQFMDRWNHSMEFWKLGKNTSKTANDTWDPSVITKLRKGLKNAITEANKLGYSSIVEWAVGEYSEYKKLIEQADNTEGGVCAVVRVKISQEAVLTRDAFTATLELENGQTKALENVLIRINIWRGGDILKTSQLAHFAVGSPVLSGLSSVDGKGMLPASNSGSAEWLIIPKQSAVLEREEVFYVGGVFEYSQKGLKTEAILTPGQITVKAQPLLELHYFHQKYIYGDDPFTKDVVEEKIPFILAVMVINKGNGTARDLKITSAQPELIDNEKGLLVDFEIVGSQVGLKDADKSMTVNFGDVKPNSVKVAQWILTSSRNGHFFNFSVSLKNINPLGDESLSLVDSVAYHELTHVVEKISVDSENFYGDFLVNDQADIVSYPETIFETLNGSSLSVNSFQTGNASVHNLHFSLKFKKEVKLSSTNGSNWHYGHAIIQKSSAPPRNYVAISFTDENGESKPLRNAWVTYSVKKKNPWISIVDFVVDNERPMCCSYNVEFGGHKIPTTTTPRSTPSTMPTTAPITTAATTAAAILTRIPMTTPTTTPTTTPITTATTIPTTTSTAIPTTTLTTAPMATFTTIPKTTPTTTPTTMLTTIPTSTQTTTPATSPTTTPKTTPVTMPTITPTTTPTTAPTVTLTTTPTTSPATTPITTLNTTSSLNGGRRAYCSSCSLITLLATSTLLFVAAKSYKN